MSWHHQDFHRGPEFSINANFGMPMWEEALPPVNPNMYGAWNNPCAYDNFNNFNNFVDCSPPIYPQQAFYSQPVYSQPYVPIIPRAHIGFGGRGFHIGVFI
ncbi:MAG TPA: hypothetical protein V6C81_30355 [Planktothrix sp.]|jgi:hypothetical protein